MPSAGPAFCRKALPFTGRSGGNILGCFESRTGEEPTTRSPWAASEWKLARTLPEAGQRTTALKGYILIWSVCGPYKEKGKDGKAIFDTVFPPENPDATNVAWKRFRRSVNVFDINLEVPLGSLDHVAAYVKTRVWSPADQEVRLEMGSDDALKAWVNGELVHQSFRIRGLKIEE